MRLELEPFHKRTSVTKIRITNLDNSEELISELMIQYNYNKFIFNYDKYIIKCKATNLNKTGDKTNVNILGLQKIMWGNIKIQNWDFFIPSYIIIPDILEIMYKFEYDALDYFLNPEKINKEIINNDYINDVNSFFTRIKKIYDYLLSNEIYVIDFKLENVAYYNNKWVLIDNDMIVNKNIEQIIPSNKLAMTWRIITSWGSIDLYKSMITAFLWNC